MTGSPSRLIALDCDGVLLDYNTAYAGLWERAFGARPVERNPQAYSALGRWEVPLLKGQALARLREASDEHFWSTMPRIEGAVEACQALVAAGFELVCVTAMDARYRAARLDNLVREGFPISEVIATGAASDHLSPKRDALQRLAPAAFVDDFLPYFRGVPQGVHRALIDRNPEDSPNKGPERKDVHSFHADLGDFARWWVQTRA